MTKSIISFRKNEYKPSIQIWKSVNVNKLIVDGFFNNLSDEWKQPRGICLEIRSDLFFLGKSDVTHISNVSIITNREISEWTLTILRDYVSANREK